MADHSSMRGSRSRKLKSEINVVPYIDVMLVLLIIFMVAAPTVTPSMINLPTAGQSLSLPTEYIQVALKKDAKAVISVVRPSDNKALSSDTANNRLDLREKLQALHRFNDGLAVMIFAEKDIRYEEVVQVIADAKKLGYQRVGLATQ